MRVFKKVFSVVVVLVLLLATTVFVLENRQSVSLVFFGWSAPQQSLAVPVILALLLGMLIGPLLAWVAGLRSKRATVKRSA